MPELFPFHLPFLLSLLGITHLYLNTLFLSLRNVFVWSVVPLPLTSIL